MAEQIKMLFGINTHGGAWNIVLDVGPDPPTNRGRKFTFQFWDPLHIYRTAEARDWKIFRACRGVGALKKSMQK